MKLILPVTIAVLAVFAKGNVTAQSVPTPPCRARTLGLCASQFMIVDALGRIIRKQDVTANTSQFVVQTEGLASGLYIARLIGGNEIGQAKFIVQH